MSSQVAPIRIVDVNLTFTDFAYRTPMKFGGRTVTTVTLLTATVRVETAAGARATGTSAMPLGNAWAWPGPPPDVTLAALRATAERLAAVYRACPEVGHPIDLTHTLEPELLAVSDAVPPLAILVAASPMDAALHDAFGQLHGASVYQLYGPDALPGDLRRFLGPGFRGRTLDEFVSPRPRATLPLYHLVGALDPLTPGDVHSPITDGLPETLADWTHADGLTHFKLKLDGAAAAWDFARISDVDALLTQVQATRGVPDWVYSLDFNERCENAAALTEFLARLQADRPAAFARVQYVEQPLPRDLHAPGAESVAAAARLKPIVVDESLTDLASLNRAVDLSYTGVAFKACKGQTQSLLLAAAATERGLFRCVQDLTCPGAALIHSAGLAAHLPGVVAIEANARQYVPAANLGWVERFPGLFTTRTGTLATGQLTGPGLGATATLANRLA